MTDVITTRWSEEDRQFVATHTDYPGLSGVAPTPTGACIALGEAVTLLLQESEAIRANLTGALEAEVAARKAAEERVCLLEDEFAQVLRDCDARGIPVFAYRYDRIVELLAQLDADAARWRALLGCERIRVIGSARLGQPDGHIGLELWGTYPDAGPQDSGRAALTTFADGLRPGPVFTPEEQQVHQAIRASAVAEAFARYAEKHGRRTTMTSASRADAERVARELAEPHRMISLAERCDEQGAPTGTWDVDLLDFEPPET